MTSMLYIIITIALLGLIIYRWWYNSPEQKGKRGESHVHELLSQLPSAYHVLDDIVLKTDKGTTQIDHVVVSPYGLFVIETKNYRGEIYGDDKRQQWTQIIATDVRYSRKWYKTYTHITKNHFYNPVRQALGHLYEIKKNLSEWRHLKIVPIVVFTGSADLSKVESNNHVVYDNDLITTIRQYQTQVLSSLEVNDILKRLTEKNVREVVDSRTHVQNIYAAKRDYQQQVSSGVCPRCGGTLILRSGRYGSFYGCSNYPNCKFTTH
ncbi:MAG: NERD domain-containing protein [Bacteroidales bacterium]|nr:NERD domain-containing protein [Bacteroidales bacterium]